MFMGQKERFYADIMAVNPEVTGSCNLVVVKLPNKETIKFVVDCGLFQERAYESDNNTLPFNPENVDFCLVTHNHVDHTGRLPLLAKLGFYNKIYATETTCKLLPLALEDSFKVLEEVSKRKHKPNIYQEVDIKRTLKLLEPIEYEVPTEVMEGVKVTFISNGHLVGAALILVQISYPGYEDISILFTGDYNNKNVFFDVKPLSEWIRNLPVTVVQESTYGDMDSTEIEETFEKNLLESMGKGATAVIPVFSLGRAQEILYELKCLQEQGKLEEQLPIYLDGKLAHRYTEIYLKDGLNIKEEMKEFLPKNLTFVEKSIRHNLLENRESKIILTTSGMGSYGPAQTYIPAHLVRPNVLIHFTGYCAEGTIGHRLKKAEDGEIVEIGGMVLKKRARVEYTSEYSAHAKADEMIEFLKQFNNLKLVLVNHGQTSTKSSFAERIVKEVDPKCVGILGKDYFFRVNPYGLVKTLTTKFE